MNAIDIARKLAQLDQREEALQAYALVIHENGGRDPMLDMEAALYILEQEGNYKISYTCFCRLYNQGHFREDILSILNQAFYAPNEEELRQRYARNCALLEKYPYCFRRDFLAFEDLPVRFYPYDDNGYLPFHPAEERFGAYVNFADPVISRNFFQDLDKPILAEDVYSQYELEYLRDNVRKSEHVARENHVYLHYTNWGTFCACLQCLDLGPVLREQKVVFLMEEEIAQYPIDFKERFGIDYSRYVPHALDVRELNRLIWHTQLSTHNGGDFFNEVFDAHPNVLMYPSVFLSNMEEVVASVGDSLKNIHNLKELRQVFSGWPFRIAKQLYEMKNCTPKDIMAAIFLRDERLNPLLDHNSRIVPALFFQPHFPNLIYDLRMDEEQKEAILYSQDYEKIRNSPLFQGFKYIKTFTPMRRVTTSYGAAIRFMDNIIEEAARKTDDERTDEEKRIVFDDALFNRVLNRSYMIDPQDRLYRDSVLVRFEDGKLNPRATFSALAAFLDLPYTESMTYCSDEGKRDPESYKGNVRGFDPAAIYKTYDEYTNDSERRFLEYFLRDAYEYYGYGFHYYDGAPMDAEQVRELIRNFTAIDSFLEKTWQNFFWNERVVPEGKTETEEEIEAEAAVLTKQYVAGIQEKRIRNAEILMRGLRLVNAQGQPLRFMPKLQLDPALLEQPLYH